MKVLKRICAILVGSVLFLAGLLKLMDPLGTGLVVKAYASFLHIGFLDEFSSVAALVIGLFEAVLGAAVIVGVWRKVIGIVLGVVLSGFTLLTLAILILNPDMDCGCFGEAIHLTHLQSFLKNVFLMILWAVAFVLPGGQIAMLNASYAAFGIVASSIVAFASFFQFNLPAFDFTVYSPGSELEDNPISACDASGNYRESVLDSENGVIVSVYSPEKVSTLQWAKISEFVDDAESRGYSAVLLCAGPVDLVESVMPLPQLFDKTYYADKKTLMTLNRSNGRAVLCRGVLIVSKNSVDDLPIKEEYSDAMSGAFIFVQIYILLAFAVMLLL